MRNLFIKIFGLLLISSSVIAQPGLFDDSVLHEIRINSTDPDFWQHIDDDYNMFYPDVPYRMATVTVDGVVLQDVGVRQKGFSSNFFSPTNKKPLKLNFGKFVEDQKYDGVKRLNIANGVGDPAITKDKVVYDMYRMHGIPGPRVAHTKIYINDTYWGIYAMIEQIDKNYLRRNFADNDGNLWKNKGNSNLNWLGTNPNSYSFELQTNETVNDWSKFIEFIDVINNTTSSEFEDQIEDIFDLDEYLRILAIDILTNNWDSYIEHGRNWYLYHEPNTNKIHWLPWDYNFAFDRGQNGQGDFTLFNNPGKVLIDKIFAVPEFRERYLTYLCEIMEVNFTDSRLEPILDAQLDLIDDDWNMATNNFFSLTDVQDGVNGNLWNGEPFGQPVQGFKKFIEDRTTAVIANIAGQNHTCVPLGTSIGFQDVVINEFMASNAVGSPWVDQDNENDDWIELFNNTGSDIDLHNYFLSDSQSFLHKWELPDVTIPANGYLIVWADKDPQQAGLHAKFDLDKDGDELFLSYIDNTIIDSIDWSEEQLENKSLSRIPNGTGAFKVADVTYNAENTDLLGVNDFAATYGIIVYPNPAEVSVNIDFTTTVASKIVVNDILGREVYSSVNENLNLEINVSNWSSGLYVIRFMSDTFNVSQKILVK